MRVQQQSTLNANTSFIPNTETSNNQNVGLVSDITNLSLAINGRLRFGDGVSGANGENIDGQWLTFTSGTSNSPLTLTHSLGSIPIGFITTNINRPAIIYVSGTTPWTGSTIYLASSTSGVTATVFLLQ